MCRVVFDLTGAGRALGSQPAPINREVDAMKFTIEGLIVAFALAAFALWLFLLAPEPGAAPRRRPVTIASVRASEGFYSVRLGDGRALVLVPLDREAPALTEGGAVMEGRTLWQGGWGYRVK
jgi:hypothetical protein